MRLNYSDLLSPLQCQTATNVNIVVQLHILKKSESYRAKLSLQPRRMQEFRGHGKNRGPTYCMRGGGG